jgi:glycosyltransferase involved in cell wall biosynthesis
LKQRPIIRNRSMSNRIKIELIATSLHSMGHDVEVISQGEVIETGWIFYPTCSEQELFHEQIPVYYGSVLPVRRLNGLWSNTHTLRLLKERHRAKPFDLVIIFNLKGPQVACADYAIRSGVPVILQYEDDRFVNVRGETVATFSARRSTQDAQRLFALVSGGIAVSPHLSAQFPSALPAILLRGAVGNDVIEASGHWQGKKENAVLFSGTHIPSNGVAPLIQGWRSLALEGWTLHITGYGELSDSLRKMASDCDSIVFHGLVSRPELVRLMASAKIAINPHQLSRIPGNVFAFKIIEYLAAGAHVLTTPMGALEPDLEAGITYMPDNTSTTIAAAIQDVVSQGQYRRTATAAAHRMYGPPAVASSLDQLIHQVCASVAQKPAARRAS